jgi:hypothetical protein
VPDPDSEVLRFVIDSAALVSDSEAVGVTPDPGMLVSDPEAWGLALDSESSGFVLEVEACACDPEASGGTPDSEALADPELSMLTSGSTILVSDGGTSWLAPDSEVLVSWSESDSEDLLSCWLDSALFVSNSEACELVPDSDCSEDSDPEATELVSDAEVLVV